MRIWRPGRDSRPIAEITDLDVSEAIEAIVVRVQKSPCNGRPGGGLYAARHAFAAARRLFKWAVKRRKIAKSPCAGLEAVELHGAPKDRDRVLTARETRLVWRAAHEIGYPFGALVKTLLLTGQRLREIAEARWSEIEGDVLTVPAERMKGGVAHTVPLAPAALEILDSLPRHAGGDYIFSTMGGKRPISGFSKMKARLDAAAATLAEESEAAPVEPYTLHDLRRTMRTGLSSEGVAPMIAALTIGHKQTGVLAIYDRHRYDGEKRAALEAWERKLKAIVAPEPTPGVVVRLPARARARA